MCHEGHQQFGLIVNRIVDIIDLPQTLIDSITGGADTFGGTQPSPLVADGRVTELLEVGRAIRASRPDLFVNEAIAEAQEAQRAMATGDTYAYGGLAS